MGFEQTDVASHQLGWSGRGLGCNFTVAAENRKGSVTSPEKLWEASSTDSCRLDVENSEGVRQLRRKPWTVVWFGVDLRPVTLVVDTDVYAGQGVKQSLLVTWKEKRQPWTGRGSTCPRGYKRKFRRHCCNGHLNDGEAKERWVTKVIEF